MRKPLTDPKLTMIAGDVTEAGGWTKECCSCQKIDGVVVALGGKTKDVGDTMLEVLQCIKAEPNNVKRIAVVTSIGTATRKVKPSFQRS
jgi:hypothetical protein